MILTGIERQKNRRGRYSLFADGEFVLGIRADVLTRSGLRRGDTITRETIVQLQHDESLAEAKAVASVYVGRRRRTEEEIRRKLSLKEFPADVIEMVLTTLRDENLVNDEEYVRAYIHDAGLGKPAGIILLNSRLRAKGIPRSILERTLRQCIPLGEEAEAAKRLATTYAEKLGRSSKNYPLPRKKALILRYLAQRGFTGNAREEALRYVSGQLSPGG